jgi:hypothetical protein
VAADLARAGVSTALRAAAIAAVGALGGQAEVPLLETLQIGQDPALQPAATAALKKVRARLAAASLPTSKPSSSAAQ